MSKPSTVISLKKHMDVMLRLQRERDQLKHDYTHRHNQALAAEQAIKSLREQLTDTKFQYAMFKHEVVRLLVLNQLPEGTQNELLATRCRNRIIDELAPVAGRATCSVVDITTEEQARQPSSEEIEQAK